MGVTSCANILRYALRYVLILETELKWWTFGFRPNLKAKHRVGTKRALHTLDCGSSIPFQIGKASGMGRRGLATVLTSPVVDFSNLRFKFGGSCWQIAFRESSSGSGDRGTGDGKQDDGNGNGGRKSETGKKGQEEEGKVIDSVIEEVIQISKDPKPSRRGAKFSSRAGGINKSRSRMADDTNDASLCTHCGKAVTRIRDIFCKLCRLRFRYRFRL